MKSIEILKGEHVRVRRLLRCLGALTVETRVTGTLDKQAAGALLRLFRRFVDRSHQEKEEEHLFPRMLARATAEEAEYLESVFGEHAQERRRLVAMNVHLDGASRGRSASVDRFVANSLLYQRLQSKHVDAEEEFVLPLAEAMLTATDDRRILEGFRELDARHGIDVHLERDIAAICRRFGLEHVKKKTRLPDLLLY